MRLKTKVYGHRLFSQKTLKDSTQTLLIHE